MSTGGGGLFRAQAVAYHERGLGSGNLVRHSAWVRWVYWTVLAAVVAAALAAAFVRVSPTLVATVGSASSATRVTMTASSTTAPPVGATVTLGADQGQVIAVRKGSLSGTFVLEVRLSRALPTGVALPDQAVLRLAAEPLAVLLYRGLTGS
jgi:hypothetical protein